MNARKARIVLAQMALAAALLCSASNGAFSAATDRKAKQAPPPPPPETQSEPAVAPPPPYETQLMRLAEVLGALHHLRTVCGAPDANVWRDRMAALIEADAPTPERRDRLAGAFNASFRTWARSYRACTPSAELAVRRFLAEASKIAADVRVRYGP